MVPILPRARSHGVELAVTCIATLPADRDGAVLRRSVHQGAQFALYRGRRHAHREVARSPAMVAGEVTAYLSDIPRSDQVVR